MSSTKALSIVLGEKRNHLIISLKNEKMELKKEVSDLEKRVQYFMGAQEVAQCRCDRCNTDIYMSTKSDSIRITLNTLQIIGWSNTYVVMLPLMDSLTYYGTCPMCTTEGLQDT
jgi:hypothetical protein